MGIYGFTIQLYCDFSGYSDMAIGIALLLGYKLKMNFDAPFKSQSPTEYWRRGTYRSLHGCATTSTFLWEATGAPRRVLT